MCSSTTGTGWSILSSYSPARQHVDVRRYTKLTNGDLPSLPPATGWARTDSSTPQNPRVAAIPRADPGDGLTISLRPAPRRSPPRPAETSKAARAWHRFCSSHLLAQARKPKILHNLAQGLASSPGPIKAETVKEDRDCHFMACFGCLKRPSWSGVFEGGSGTPPFSNQHQGVRKTKIRSLCKFRPTIK